MCHGLNIILAEQNLFFLELSVEISLSGISNKPWLINTMTSQAFKFITQITFAIAFLCTDTYIKKIRGQLEVGSYLYSMGPRIELRSSNWATNPFSHWAISLTVRHFFHPEVIFNYSLHLRHWNEAKLLLFCVYKLSNVQKNPTKN